MGLLESEFQFTGRLGNLTAYRMRGVDKIIVRKKGGASKERIRTARCFVRTRENNAEFSGRARGVHCVRVALAPVRFLSDYNYVGHINRLKCPIEATRVSGYSDSLYEKGFMAIRSDFSSLSRSSLCEKAVDLFPRKDK